MEKDEGEIKLRSEALAALRLGANLQIQVSANDRLSFLRLACLVRVSANNNLPQVAQRPF